MQVTIENVTTYVVAYLDRVSLPSWRFIFPQALVAGLPADTELNFTINANESQWVVMWFENPNTGDKEFYRVGQAEVRGDLADDSSLETTFKLPAWKLEEVDILIDGEKP